MSTTSTLQRLQQLAQDAKASAVDMTVVQTRPEFEKLPPIPEGTHPMQFIKYIEYGRHHPTSKNVVDLTKPARLEFKATFAVWCDGFDKPARFIDTGYFRLAVSTNDKAKAFKMFKSMNNLKDVTTFPELLGRTFLGKITHSVGIAKEGKEAPIYDNLVTDGFSALVNPVTKQPYEVPALDDNVWGMFLWAQPTIEDWNALFIEGTTDEGVSRNYIQNAILAAVDYPESPLAALLGGATLPGLTAPSIPTAEATVVPTAPSPSPFA